MRTLTLLSALCALSLVACQEGRELEHRGAQTSALSTSAKVVQLTPTVRVGNLRFFAISSESTEVRFEVRNDGDTDVVWDKLTDADVAVIGPGISASRLLPESAGVAKPIRVPAHNFAQVSFVFEGGGLMGKGAMAKIFGKTVEVAP